MILIADGGSTKVDWVALDSNKKELFRVQTKGINPSVLNPDEIICRIKESNILINAANEVEKVFFYGAGCGTQKPIELLKNIFQNIFKKAIVHVHEDMLAAVYASSGNKKAIVCILGTGSNSCYFDGEKLHYIPSLGYIIMDEASGNYFGKKLLRDFYYKKMPKKLRTYFKEIYNLEPDYVKENLYKKESPNMYLASHAKFMLEHKNKKYIKKLVKKGFKEFFKYRISYHKQKNVPVYFIGSIAYYFQNILEEVAINQNYNIEGIIQRPIDNLIKYHKETNL